VLEPILVTGVVVENVAIGVAEGTKAVNAAVRINAADLAAAVEAPVVIEADLAETEVHEMTAVPAAVADLVLENRAVIRCRPSLALRAPLSIIYTFFEY
jgi:hypothetical protein